MSKSPKLQESDFDGDLFPHLHPYLTTCRDLLAADVGTRLESEKTTWGLEIWMRITLRVEGEGKYDPYWEELMISKYRLNKWFCVGFLELDVGMIGIDTIDECNLIIMRSVIFFVGACHDWNWKKSFSELVASFKGQTKIRNTKQKLSWKRVSCFFFVLEKFDVFFSWKATLGTWNLKRHRAVRVVDGCVIDLEIYKAIKDDRDLHLWTSPWKFSEKNTFLLLKSDMPRPSKTSFCLPKLGDILLGVSTLRAIIIEA